MDAFAPALITESVVPRMFIVPRACTAAVIVAASFHSTPVRTPPLNAAPLHLRQPRRAPSSTASSRRSPSSHGRRRGAALRQGLRRTCHANVSQRRTKIWKRTARASKNFGNERMQRAPCSSSTPQRAAREPTVPCKKDSAAAATGKKVRVRGVSNTAPPDSGLAALASKTQELSPMECSHRRIY